ncbi:hypothetical protein LZ906_010405 [Paraclostridium ghonii]|uniref:hypothetical protein n=1 Tax=Paraclostridium ghonii TaxID=29358 RepID=UPI00307248C6|nr:hypothetical protein [Paeniclostridium ghonii]
MITLKNTNSDVPIKLNKAVNKFKKSVLDEKAGILPIIAINGMVIIGAKIEPRIKKIKAKTIAKIKFGNFLEVLSLSNEASFFVNKTYHLQVNYIIIISQTLG